MKIIEGLRLRWFFSFWQLLVGSVSSFRYDGVEINPNLAKHEAVKNKKGNLEEVIRILTTRSRIQLKATFNRYRDDHGFSISKVTEKKKLSEDLKNISEFYCEECHNTKIFVKFLECAFHFIINRSKCTFAPSSITIFVFLQTSVTFLHFCCCRIY